jgi:hypothetical protein
MEKGGYPHQPYGPKSTPGGGAFDHHEPIIGIGSNHDLNDSTVYDDDWVLHYSNQDLMPYYRKFSTLEDGLHMNGNCLNASTSYPNREAFPCFYEQVAYGLAVNGLDTNVSSLPLYIDVDHQDEPNIRIHQKPILLRAKVMIQGLRVGGSYILYRYKGFNSFPAANAGQGYDSRFEFVASAENQVHQDPKPFLSDGAVYYMAVAASLPEVLV